MKINRYKKVNKYLGFYRNNFGFRQPYQILVDGTFCNAALQNKINISDNIPHYLHGEVKFLTTPCAILEMEKLGNKVVGALLILKKFAFHKCGHDKKPIPGSNCFLSMVGTHNQNHYIIATQDRDLEKKIRTIPGVPLLYLHMKTPVLEEPSRVSMTVAKEKVSSIGQINTTVLDQMKKQEGIVSDKIDKPRKKKIKGPNPLSCKKKKKNPQSTIRKQTAKPEIEKIKRKRVRIPEHVKKELLRTKN